MAGVLVEQEQYQSYIAVIVGVGMNVKTPVSVDQPTFFLSERVDIDLMGIDWMMDQIIWDLVYW